MGVGLVRSLQPPEILRIHWRVYNFIANTNNGVLFLPTSNAYVRSFLYLLYTLLHKSSERSSLVSGPDWILLLRGPSIPALWFNNNLSRLEVKVFHNDLSPHFWCLYQKLSLTKALSNQALSLAPDWILLLRGPRIPASWFNNNLSVS